MPLRPAVDFAHVVMTRFNLATPGRESAIRNRAGWLEERFALFERHCLPTMAAQTCRDFTWIVYFDEGTPEPFRARIEACRQVAPFTPYFTPLFQAEGWPRSVRETIGQAVPLLLTTRLDNDDGLAVDYVARMQAAVAASDGGAPCAFNFTEGFLLQGDRLYAHSHRSNAFASVLEAWADGPLTAPGIEHMRLAERGAVRQIDGPGAWLQVVHGGNVSNRVRGRRVPPATAAERFPIAATGPLSPVSPLALGVENVVMGPVRALRDAAAGLLRRGRA